MYYSGSGGRSQRPRRLSGRALAPGVRRQVDGSVGFAGGGSGDG